MSAIFLVLNLCAGKIYAQEKNYYFTEDADNNIKFIQKLSWQKAQGEIKAYRIEIQKQTTGGYETIFKEDVTENFVEVSLAPGNYRFDVGIVNWFDKVGQNSGWKNFEVLPVIKPQVDNITPEKKYLNDDGNQGIFTISGKNLTEKTVFKMYRNNDEEPIYGTVMGVSEDNQTAQIQFNVEELEKGAYRIEVENPGGLSDTSKVEQMKVALVGNDKALLQIMASAGYFLPITISGKELEDVTGTKVYPISAGGRIAVIPYHTKLGNFGFGVNANFSMIKSSTSNYDFSANYLAITLSALYQRYIIPKKLSFDIHGNVGFAMLMDMEFNYKNVDYSSPKITSAGLAFGGGLAVQYYLLKHLYVEGGIDFIQAKFNDMDLGMISPSVSIGGKF